MTARFDITISVTDDHTRAGAIAMQRDVVRTPVSVTDSAGSTAPKRRAGARRR